MNKTIIWISGIIAALALAIVLCGTGFLIGRASWGMAGFWPAGMMGRFTNRRVQPGVPLGRMFNFRQTIPEGAPDGYGYSGMGPGMMGGGGMMGGYGSSGLSPAKPLSIEEAQTAVEKYLASLGYDNLEVKEVMIFDNQAYAEIVEKSTGIGAMEVLVDPGTLTVYPEYGPNMMWNLKYGMMSGYGMMGGMTGGMMGRNFRQGGTLTPPEVSAEMPVSPEQAIQTAQAYLDSYLPGTQVEEHADPFYGYYTLHILRDGKTVGMLSVNGYNQQVFPHTWHGTFIEMNEEGDK